MRTKNLFILGFFLSVCMISYGQQKNRTVEQKVADVMSRFDEELKLDKNKRDRVESVFATYYTAQRKLREDIQKPPSGLAQGVSGQDYQSLRKSNEAIITERDEALGKILSDDEFKKWKEEIETSLKHKKK